MQRCDRTKRDDVTQSQNTHAVGRQGTAQPQEPQEAEPREWQRSERVAKHILLSPAERRVGGRAPGMVMVVVVADASPDVE